DMAQFDVLDVERNAAAFTRSVDDLIRIDEQDARLRIEEAEDQPWAGDTIDLWPPPRHPKAWPIWGDALKFFLCDQRQPGFCPGFVTALQNERVDTIGAQLRGGGLAHFVPGLAGDDNRLAGFGRPLFGFCGVAPDCAGQQVRRFVVGVASSYVDDVQRIARCN